MESRVAPRLLGYAGLAPAARFRGSGEKRAEPARLSAAHGAPRKGGRAVTSMHSTGKVRRSCAGLGGKVALADDGGRDLHSWH